jgi:putative polyketide hydroxylase
VPRSRAAVPSRPAGCFPCRRLGSYHQPAATVGSAAKHRGVQDAHNLAWKLWQRCSTARLVPRSTRYTYHTMNGTQSDCSHYMQQAFARFGSRMGQGAEVPLIDYGAVTMGYYRYTARRPYSARRRTSRRCSHQGRASGRAWYTRAPHIAVITFGGREIFPPSTCTDGALCCLLAGANGAAWISAAERVMQRLDVPLYVCIYRFGVELGGAEVAAAAHRLETDGALLVRPDGFVAWRTEVAAEDHERTLERVMCRLLCRTPGAS